MGGPLIPFRSGRLDQPENKIPPEGRLPDADKGTHQATNTHVREIFDKMGIDDREIICLLGCHSLGETHAHASGYDGPWTATPNLFGNQYYKSLMNIKWEPHTTSAGNHQFNSFNKELMMLPAELAFLEDEIFMK